MYEWVCQRKYQNNTWGEFSTPALWAKWGEKGEPGKDGADGTSINIKGSVSSVEELPQSANIGDAYVVNGDLYVWDGLTWNNVGGIKGPAGDSAYVHIAFADGVVTNESGEVTEVIGFTVSGSVNKAYIGTCADHNVADPQDPLVYKWQKNKGDKGDKGDDGNQGPQGVKGDPGEDGRTYYTWIRYADTASGGGISNFPDGKDYIGLAYNKDTAIESNDPDDYTWSKIKGEEGVAGPKGDDGETLYTWIKYADTLPTSSSSTIYDIPNDNTKYIGISVNNSTATESTDPMVYTWSLFRGKDGIDGSDGTNGKDGRDGRIVYPAGIYDATVTYTATDTKAPYVLHGEGYWVMNKTTSWLGTANENKTPQDNYEEFGDNATWIPMEQFDAVYAKLLIADNGTLGKFVFNGNYMFSQEGVNSDGDSSNNYEDFNPDSPDSGSFQPNFYVNGLTGKVVARNAYIKGAYKEQTKLVDNSSYSYVTLGGGNISVNRSVDDIMGKGTHQHISVGSGWIYDVASAEKQWSAYTVTNISDTPLLITNYFSGCFKAFCYLGDLYYGVILPSKYSSVTLTKIRVPNDTAVDFDGISNAGYVNELVLISPNQNRVASIVDNWTVGSVTYKMLQL